MNNEIKCYLRLMHELSIRMEIVDQAHTLKLNLTPPYIREYSYFQFRRMLEIIALGCLKLHSYLPVINTSRTRKEWNAEKMISLLCRQYKYGFPHSVAYYKNEKGEIVIEDNPNKNDLTIDEFKRLYAECGEVLHRGSVSSIESERDSFFYRDDYEKTIFWLKKIFDLMKLHIIYTQNVAYICEIRSKSGYPELESFTKDETGFKIFHEKNRFVVTDEVADSYVENKRYIQPVEKEK